MKPFSTFSSKLQAHPIFFAYFTIFLLSLALVAVTSAYIYFSTQKEIGTREEKIRIEHYEQIASNDLFKLASSIEADLSSINWISVELRDREIIYYRKSRKPGIDGFFSAKAQTVFNEKKGLTLAIVAGPKIEELGWLAVVVLTCTFLCGLTAFAISKASDLRTQRERNRADRAARLVHDLKGLATTIKTLALDSSSASREETISMIGSRMTSLISDVHGITNPLSSKNLNELVVDVLTTFSKARKNKKIFLNGPYIALASLSINDSKLFRIFYNLFDNAFDQNIGATQIKVSWKTTPDSHLAISFADNGIGVPKEIRDRLFTAGTTYGKIGGSGLGLSSVKELVEDAGGKIQCRFEPETIMELSIPMR